MSLRSFKIELKLNKTQSVLCAKSAGTSRFAFNRKLKELSESYKRAKIDAIEQGLKKPKCKFGTSIDWHKEWVLLKSTKGYKWIKETSKCCGQEALRDLEVAFKRFFAQKSGYPRFKKHGEKDSFRLTGIIKVGPDWIQLPTFGKIKLKEKGYVVSEGVLRVSQATVKRQVDRWFVSFVIDDGSQDQPLADLTSINIEDIVS